MAYPTSPTLAQCTLNPCLPGCPGIVTPQENPEVMGCEFLCNRSFECPIISSPVESVLAIDVPCWDTNHKSFNIEIWKGTGNAGPLPHTGNQYIRLPIADNTSSNRKVFQNVLLPFSTNLIITFWHAGRVGSLNNITVSLGHQDIFIPRTPVNDPSPLILGNFTAIDNVWTKRTITINLTPNFSALYAIIFESNDTSPGGNFIDDVSISAYNSQVIALSNSPIVLGGTINLTSSTLPSVTYAWTGPNGFTSTNQNPSIPSATLAMGGVYTVTTTTGETEQGTGCQSTASVTVVILECNLSVIANSNSPILIGNSLNLTSVPSGGIAPYTFLWSGPNGFSSAVQNPSFIVTSLLEAGTYTVQITDSAECIALADTDVEVFPLPCFIITDCNTIDPQPPFTTSTDLMSYDGKIVKFCDSIPEWLPGCYCATITKSLSCAIAIPLPGFIGSILVEFDDCITCHPYCYLLTDCSDPLNIILVSNDFANYVGLIVKLKGCNTCWEVSKDIDCTGAVCGDPVVIDEDSLPVTYNTCLECLPPVLVIPKEELCTRSVKPGYNTPGCSPAYTEKINCNFAEAVYDQMVVVRYGITICCDLDLDSLDIKKQELDLRTIFDPNLCETIVPECITCNDDCPPIIS